MWMPASASERNIPTNTTAAKRQSKEILNANDFVIARLKMYFPNETLRACE